MKVTVVLALPQAQPVVELTLPEGATLADALAAAGFTAPSGLEAFDVGIWSRRCPPETVLREGDRVEVYRPLEADAKAQRRSRAASRATRSRSGP